MMMMCAIDRSKTQTESDEREREKKMRERRENTKRAPDRASAGTGGSPSKEIRMV